MHAECLECRVVPSVAIPFPGFAGPYQHVRVDGLDVYAAGKGGGPHVKVYNADGDLLASFFAYDPAFRGGVNVGVLADRIVTGPGVGGGPHVELWSGAGILLDSFFAFDPGWRFGAMVAGGVRGEGDVVIVEAGGWLGAYSPGGTPLAGWHPGGEVTQAEVDSFAAFPRPVWYPAQSIPEAEAWGARWGMSSIGPVTLDQWNTATSALSLCPESVLRLGLSLGGTVHVVGSHLVSDDPTFAGIAGELSGDSGAFGVNDVASVAVTGWPAAEVTHALAHELGHRLDSDVFRLTGRVPSLESGLGTEPFADRFAGFCLGQPDAYLAGLVGTL